MIEASRRSFLIGLFGATAVAAAGPIPKVIEALSQKDFESAATKAKANLLATRPKDNEIYGNGKDYIFAKIEYLNEAPWFKVTIPEGYRPLREESDHIANEAIERMYREL